MKKFRESYQLTDEVLVKGAYGMPYSRDGWQFICDRCKLMGKLVGREGDALKLAKEHIAEGCN